ncbi:MAG TPA: hypothetical protein VNK06_00560, partial [Thermodesulfobacteriota bacterium]|nr:hypothetical protein [Thermodesulfobacteriota bacterium]
TSSTGRVYEGEWKEDKQSGKGVLVWPDGDRYAGEFKNDMFDGFGTYTFADGRKYEGSWKDDKFNGRGTYSWPDGDRYVGEWKNGTSPSGQLTRTDGTVISGSWEEILNRKFPSEHAA